MKENDFRAKRLDDFDENLLKEFDEILGNPGTGSSTQERILPSGRKITHHCSWSTGMGWLHSLKNYESNFGDAPSWLIYFHPVHRIRLCTLAIDFNSPIPEKSSNIIKWVCSLLNRPHNVVWGHGNPKISGCRDRLPTNVPRI